MATLRIQGLDIYVDEKSALPTPVTPEKPWQEISTMVANFISELLRPEICLRVPACERSNARLLLQRLEAMCAHFRFLGLPGELRDRIYRFALTGCDCFTLGGFGEEYPSITKVSHQIREEVLPVFYASTPFVFDLDYMGNNSSESISELG